MSCLYRHEKESGMQWSWEHGNKKKTGAKESYCKMNSQVRGWIAACNSAQPTNLHLMSLSRVRGRTLALYTGLVLHINNTLFAIENFHVHEQLHFCYVTSHACTIGVITKFAFLNVCIQCLTKSTFTLCYHMHGIYCWPTIEVSLYQA